jgi:hypothetical protein
MRESGGSACGGGTWCLVDRIKHDERGKEHIDLGGGGDEGERRIGAWWRRAVEVQVMRCSKMGSGEWIPTNRFL